MRAARPIRWPWPRRRTRDEMAPAQLEQRVETLFVQLEQAQEQHGHKDLKSPSGSTRATGSRCGPRPPDCAPWLVPTIIETSKRASSMRRLDVAAADELVRRWTRCARRDADEARDDDRVREGLAAAPLPLMAAARGRRWSRTLVGGAALSEVRRRPYDSIVCGTSLLLSSWHRSVAAGCGSGCAGASPR